jgi:hypothetical protein
VAGFAWPPSAASFHPSDSILQTQELNPFFNVFLTNWVIKNFNMAALINTIEIKRELVLGLY